MNDCPRCKSVHLVTGSLLDKWQTKGSRPHVFEPQGLEYWAFRKDQGIPTLPPLSACLQCGLIWTEVNAGDLVQFLKEHGTEETRRSVSQGFPE